jgi:hypothetical protein
MGGAPHARLAHGNGTCTPPSDGRILDSKNLILPEDPAISPAGGPIVHQLGVAVGNVHYRVGGEPTLLCVCFGEVKSEARSDQLITFARFFGETLPIKDRDLPAAALNQA